VGWIEVGLGLRRQKEVGRAGAARASMRKDLTGTQVCEAVWGTCTQSRRFSLGPLYRCRRRGPLAGHPCISPEHLGWVDTCRQGRGNGPPGLGVAQHHRQPKPVMLGAGPGLALAASCWEGLNQTPYRVLRVANEAARREATSTHKFEAPTVGKKLHSGPPKQGAGKHAKDSALHLRREVGPGTSARGPVDGKGRRRRRPPKRGSHGLPAVLLRS
jgi:hypothetical protein